MKQQEPVDWIFKQQLQSLPTDREELLWQQLSNQLHAKKRKKRLGIFWISFLFLSVLLGSLAWNVWNTNSSKATTTAATSIHQEGDIKEGNTPLLQSRTNIDATDIGQQSGQLEKNVNSERTGESVNNKHQQSLKHRGKMLATVTAPNGAMEDKMELLRQDSSNIVGTMEKQILFPSLMDIDKQGFQFHLPSPINDSLPKLTNEQQKEWNGKQWHVQLVAGTDLFGKNNQLGYQLGFRLVRTLKNGAEWSIGLQYASTQLSNKYRIANKPAQLTGIDAELNNLAMVQLPIVFQQRFNHSRFYGRVGLAPIYILSASIYNLPNNYTGSPFQFKQFTINDIHAVNLLFTAGVGFKWHTRWALELNGTYGMTELVKNSYINQSRVDGSLKNIQATLVFQLKK